MSKFWNGEEVCSTLTANNAGGAQRMPDKDNFNCVLVEPVISTTGYYITCNTDGIAPALLSRDYKDPPPCLCRR